MQSSLFPTIAALASRPEAPANAEDAPASCQLMTSLFDGMETSMAGQERVSCHPECERTPHSVAPHGTGDQCPRARSIASGGPSLDDWSRRGLACIMVR